MGNAGTKELGPGNWSWDMGLVSWNLGPGAQDHSWETRLWIYDLGPGPRA